MSANISVITNNTKDAISAVVDAFNGNALAHINGDFGAHNQCRVYAIPFVEPVTGHVVSDHSLRIQLFNPNTDQLVAFIIPCFVEGSINTGGPPVIIIEPVALLSAIVGTTQQFSVSVASQTPPTYQWQRLITSGFTNLNTQVSSVLVFPNVQTTDAGAYRVVVSNSFGSVVSTTGSLTATVSSGGGGGGCLLPGTQISMANGTFKNVEDVRVGDTLLSFDGPPVMVMGLLPNSYNRHYVINNRLRITWEHPIAIKTGNSYTLTEAKDVQPNDLMCKPDGTFEKVVTKYELHGNVDTYNFNASGNHLYVAEGIVVHNPTSQKT